MQRNMCEWLKSRLNVNVQSQRVRLNGKINNGIYVNKYEQDHI